MPKVDLKSPAFQKIVLSVILCAGLVFMFFCTHLIPFGFPNQKDRLNALKSEHEKKSTELSRARSTVADLPRFEAEYKHLHERWEMAAELLPTDRQMPGLLRKITLFAQQTGVEFMVFRPAPVKPEQHYTELPLAISVYGQYHQIGSFIAELANMRRIVTVAELHLKSSPNNAVTTAAEFTASAYSLNAAAAPAPAPTAKDRRQGEANANPS